MGAWDTGLYSDDYAIDLRTTIGGLLRLPFDGDELLQILKREETCADDPDEEDHTLFWLVTAHQFARRGVPCAQAKQRALEIIETGRDIESRRQLGMEPADLRARQKALHKIADELQSPPPAKPRRTMTKPQPLLLEPGSVYRYPTMRRDARDPYFATAAAEGFVADGWGAFLVVDVGLAFGWLAWYAVVPMYFRHGHTPTLKHVPRAHFYRDKDADVTDTLDIEWEYGIHGGPGTLTPTQMKRLELELLGKLAVVPERVPSQITENATSYAADNWGIHRVLEVAGCHRGGPRVADWLAD